MTKRAENLTHFSSDEIISARLALAEISDDSIENEQDYLIRKREKAITETVRKIIDEELDEIKREIFVSAFFRGEKFVDIAQRLNLANATVYKHYHAALRILENNLKYVIFYRDSCVEALSPLRSMQKRANDSRNNVYINAFSLRLKRLMEKEQISVKSMCNVTGFDTVRFEKILGGKLKADADEIVLISGFFGVSADYILKGDLT